MTRPVFQSTAVDEEGNVLPSATVTVTDEDTAIPVALYDAFSGGSSLSNPFNAEADGFFQFYTDPALRVKIVVTLGGDTAEYRDVLMASETSYYDVLSSANDWNGTNTYNQLVTFDGLSTFNAPASFDSPPNFNTGSFYDSKFFEVVAGTDGGDITQINGVGGLNTSNLSNDNSGTSTSRATTEAGVEARMTRFNGEQNFGTAAYVDLTNSTFTPTLSASFGTTITEGGAASYSAEYKIFGEWAQVQLKLYFDDSASSPVLGDRIKIIGLPAEIQPDFDGSVFSCGTMQLYYSLGTGKNAFYAVTLLNDSSDIWLTCTSIFGAVDYGAVMGGTITYKV